LDDERTLSASMIAALSSMIIFPVEIPSKPSRGRRRARPRDRSGVAVAVAVAVTVAAL
jgi:hypothetical protein